MNLLITIFSCAADRANGRQQVSRDTWVKEWKNLVDYKYLLAGKHENPASDELIWEDLDTSYEGLPFRTQRVNQWALERGYTHIFSISDDIYVAVPRLLDANLWQYQYAGNQTSHDGNPYVSGAGIWLGTEAMQAIARGTPNLDYDDVWVGQQMAAALIPIHDDKRFWAGDQWLGKPFDNDWKKPYISAHLGRGRDTFAPIWMVQTHRRYLDDTAV
jgi:hypothetical protein